LPGASMTGFTRRARNPSQACWFFISGKKPVFGSKG